MRTSIHSGGTGNNRHSPRNGWNGFLRALPGDEFLFATIAARIEWFHVPGWVDKTSARLSISNGCQDHTTSPYATMPLVLRVCRSLTGEPALRPRFARDAAASTASHPNVRDDREAPLFGRGGMARANHIFLKNRSDLFFARGLDRNSQSLPDGQITWRRTARKRLWHSAFFHSHAYGREAQDSFALSRNGFQESASLLALSKSPSSRSLPTPLKYS